MQMAALRSSLPFSCVSGRDEFVSRWSDRVGEDAARLSVSSARAIGLGGVLVPVWSVLFVIAHGSPALVALASVLVLVDVILLTSGIVAQRRMFALLSQRFGTKVWFLNSPSLREGQFQAWCARHGVDPDRGRPAERP